MQLNEIVTELSNKLDKVTESTNQVVYAITMQDVIAEIARTLGEKAVNMTVDDLLDIRHEIQIAIDHGFDARDFIQPGIEVWQIKRD